MLSFVLFFVMPVLGWIFAECFVSSKRRLLKIVGWTGLIFCTVLFGIIWDIWASALMIAVFLLEMLWFVTEKNEKISIKSGMLKLWSYLKI